MDDIYSNLENYNEVNILEELQSENKELKFKLEEYAVNMDKLQKDFDKLASEFKRLEMNYSSLLKTARAEIERKTNIINKLNMEKDMLVINSVSNGNRNVLNVKTNVNALDNKIKEKKIHDSNIRRGMRETNKKLRNDIERNQHDHLHSQDLNNVEADQSNADRQLRGCEQYDDRKNEFKENVSQEFNKHNYDNSVKKSLPCSIRNRRKSMPVLSQQSEKFSSDEECATNSYLPETNKDTYDRLESKTFDKRFKQNKISESSSMDDKYSYPSSKEGNYKGTFERRYNKESYKSRKKEDSYQYTRHSSPNRRYEWKHDNYRRRDQRTRVLESPPSNRHLHQNRDYHNDYEKNYNYHNFGKRRNYQERQHRKHKVQSDHDEIGNKRLRMDSYNRHEEADFRTLEENFNRTEITESMPHLQFHSCESPDYVQVDTIASVSPVKEIMSTASTKLEDPRLTSKKYSKKTVDDIVMLSTAIGRDVDLKIIDKIKWNIEQVQVPDALLHHPSQFSDNVVKEIYLDIDTPLTNSSVESGEIVNSESNYDFSANLNTGMYSHKNVDEYNNDKPKVIEDKLSTEQHQIRGKDVNIQENQIEYEQKLSREQNQIRGIDVNTEENQIEYETEIGNISKENLTSKEFCTKYKIPKIKKHDKFATQNLERDVNINITDNKNPVEVCKYTDSTADVDKNTLEGENKNPGFVLSQKCIPEVDIHKLDNISTNEDLNKKDMCTNFSEQSVSPKILENRKIIEDDLELSDETIDNLGFQRSKTESLNKQKSKTKSKIHKHKDAIIKETTVVFPKSDYKKDNKLKSKKEKESESIHIQTKFSDLFGDSSSLITPDDLGINVLRSEPVSRYDPDFEDVQNAVDLNVEEMIKVQTRSRTKIDTGEHEEGQHMDDANKCETRSKSKSRRVNIESKKKKSKKKEIEKEAPSDETTKVPDVYENLTSKSESVEEDGVVKTVIISTGVQLQCSSEVEIICNSNVTQQGENIMPELQEDSVRNFATSTPEKQTSISSLIDSKATSSDNTTNTSENVMTNSKGDTDDVPDVRIFVKRRRRVKNVIPSPQV